MIDIAIPPVLRRDATIRRSMSDVKSGKPDALERLYARLLEDIPDPNVQQMLRENRAGVADAKIRLRVYLEKRVEELRHQYLHPAHDSAPTPVEAVNAADSWAEEIEVVRRTAERLWRDDFLTDTSVAEAGRRRGRVLRFWSRSTPDRNALEQVIFRSWLLMLLYAEASLYSMRSNSNYQSREGVRARRAGWWRRGHTTRQQVAQVVKGYQRRLRRWDRELFWVTGRRFFRRQLGDSQRFKTLSKEFGPDGLDERAEPGWATLATDAGNELRYRYLDARRRENVRLGNPFVALWSLIQKWTTGYGTKPIRFVRTAVIIVATFGLLFFANDYFNPGVRADARFCPAVSVSHMPLWEIVAHYLYIAVTNLTSLGSNAMLAQYCGGMMTELLLVASSLTGYFLLATLAALFYQQIRDADS